jgi:hypothetical protein
VKYLNKCLKTEHNNPNAPQNVAGIYFGKLAITD